MNNQVPDEIQEVAWNILEGFARVSRWTRDQLEPHANWIATRLAPDLPPRTPPAIDKPESNMGDYEYEEESLQKDWELVNLERWASTVYAQVDTLVSKENQKERVRKGGIHLLIDDELIAEMEEKLKAFEWINVSSEEDKYSGHAEEELVQDAPPLTLSEFHEMLRQQDCSKNIIPNLCSMIYKRGLEAESRTEIWCYLLGIYPWGSSEEERSEIRTSLVKEYEILCQRWTHPQQEQYPWLADLIEDRKHRVEKDVVRTENSSAFYQVIDGSVSPSNESDHGSTVAIESLLRSHPRWTQLRDILLTYSIYRLDVGYVQGMSDIAASILSMVYNDNPSLEYSIEKQALAFWIFVHFLHPFQRVSDEMFDHKLMRALPHVQNFHPDQSGLRTRLILILYSLRLFDPDFYQRLADIDGLTLSKESQPGGSGATSLFWLFRSVLLVFKRDVADKEIVRLWDGLLSARWFSTTWMDVWFIIAIVKLYIRERVLSETPPEAYTPESPIDSFETLLRLMHQLSGEMRSNDILAKALQLCNHYQDLLEPPNLNIETSSSDPQIVKLNSSPYWQTNDNRSSELLEELASSEKRADASRSAIVDMKISIEEAICMLNTTFIHK